jgi:hypothetical protein
MNMENNMQLTVTWDGDRATFAKAFVAAQMATEAVKKAASNPAFKSKYADLSEVVEAVVPALNKAGIGVMQFPEFDGEWVGVTTTLMHESGASVTGTLRLRPSKSDPQGVGSAVTYARRYSLLAMTGAAPEDDDGNSASGPREQPRQPRREEPQESAAVQAAGVAIGLCGSEAVLAKWSADNAPMIAKLDAADKAEVRRLYGLRLQALKASPEHDLDPFEEAA